MTATLQMTIANIEIQEEYGIRAWIVATGTPTTADLELEAVDHVDVPASEDETEWLQSLRDALGHAGYALVAEVHRDGVTVTAAVSRKLYTAEAAKAAGISRSTMADYYADGRTPGAVETGPSTREGHPRRADGVDVVRGSVRPYWLQETIASWKREDQGKGGGRPPKAAAAVDLRTGRYTPAETAASRADDLAELEHEASMRDLGADPTLYPGLNREQLAERITALRVLVRQDEQASWHGDGGQTHDV